MFNFSYSTIGYILCYNIFPLKSRRKKDIIMNFIQFLTRIHNVYRHIPDKCVLEGEKKIFGVGI